MPGRVPPEAHARAGLLVVPTLWSTLEGLSVKSRPLWQEAQLVAPSARPERVAEKAVRPAMADAVRVPSVLRNGLRGTTVSDAT
jgi:hypothetical protein